MPAMISSSNNSAYKRRIPYPSKPQPPPQQSRQQAAVAPLVEAPERAASSPLPSMAALKLPEFPKLPFMLLRGGSASVSTDSPAKRPQEQRQMTSPTKQRPADRPRRAYRWGAQREHADVAVGVEESRDEQLQRLHALGSRSEGSSPTTAAHSCRSDLAAAPASVVDAEAGCGGSLAIPLPPTHVRRTASELQLSDDLAEAERRGWAMYARCVVRGGVNDGAPPLPRRQQQVQVPVQQRAPVQQQQQAVLVPRYVEPEPQFGLPLDDDDDEQPAVLQQQPPRHHHQPCRVQYQGAHVLKPTPIKADASAFLTETLQPKDYGVSSNANRYPGHCYGAAAQHHQDYAAASQEDEVFDMEL